MKKVMTFLFAFALLSVVAFGQSREELSEKAGSIVQEMNKEMSLTAAQQDQAAEVLTDALVDITNKQHEGVDREGYIAFRNERMLKAFNSMDEFLVEEQIETARKLAAEKGWIATQSR